jgi:hypothetical protein
MTDQNTEQLSLSPRDREQTLLPLQVGQAGLININL